VSYFNIYSLVKTVHLVEQFHKDPLYFSVSTGLQSRNSFMRSAFCTCQSNFE